MPIIDIQRRLAQAGRIRIGEQVATGNGRKRPSKLSTFRLTSQNKAALDAAALRYGGTVAQWEDAPTGVQWELLTTSSTLSVLVPPEQMSFSQYYELWSGGGCQRRCNGAFQIPSEEDCVCDPDNRECKPHTRLSVMLADLPGAGLWRLDTQGWNASVEIGGAFELAQLIARASGRAILPGVLRLEQREVKRPGEQTRKFAVPVLDFDVDMNALARGEQPALESRGLTPVETEVDVVSLAVELEKVNTPEPRKQRANSAEPIRPTGIKPRARGVVIDEDGRQYDDEPFDNDNATPAQLEKLRTAISMLDDSESDAFKSQWKEEQLPPIHSLTGPQADRALEIASNILNALSEPESGETGVVDGTDGTGQESANTPHTATSADTVNADSVKTPMANQGQIAKIRLMVGQLGVDSRDIHTHVSDIMRRQIGSLKELTKAEAGKVIDQLVADSGGR